METLPQLLLRNARAHGTRPALREKRRGLWHETTWTEVLQSVRALALGLLAGGVKRGAEVLLRWRNRPECVVAELAIQAVGAVAAAGEIVGATYPLPDTLDELIAAGAAIPATRFEECVAQGSAADRAFGQLSHQDLLTPARALSAGGELFSFQSLDQPFEQIASVAAWLESGLCLSFPERSETRLADLREIGPSLIHAEAPFWDGLHAHALSKRTAATPFKRLMFDRYLEKRGILAEVLLLRPLRDRLGLSRVKSARAVGVAPAAATLRFFHALGLPLIAGGR